MIGILIPEPLPFPAFDAFRQGLRDLGYVEGRTIVLDPRWPAGRQFDDYLATAKDFVHHNVDVIVAGHTLSSRAAKAATQTIPIITAALGADPIELGFAKSMARPGYNVTGMSLQTNELPGKRLELIKDLMPTASRIAMLLIDNDFGRKTARDHEAPARILGLEPLYLEVHGPGDFEAAFERAKRGQADAVLLTQSALFYANAKPLAELSLKYRLPLLSGESGFAAVGGLINHGPNISASWKRSASFVDRILKGEKPGELPFEQPTRFELVVNLKTAKALGLTVPPSILVRADEVIE